MISLAADDAAIRTAYAAGAPSLLTGSAPADLDTPVSAMLKLGRDRPNAFLLESVEGGNYRGRYSILGLDPDLMWRVIEGRAQLADGDAAVRAGQFTDEAAPPRDSLRALVERSALDIPEHVPPPAAGLFGYLGYDMAREVEPRLPPPGPDPVGAPTALLVRPSVVLVFDALKQDITAYTPIRPTPGVSAEEAITAGRRRLERVGAALARPLPRSTRGAPVGEGARFASASPSGAYAAAVKAAKGYITDGDAFQIVPSQRFAAPFTLPPFALYRALRRLNPSPFLFYFNLPDVAIVGSSPEILVRVRDGVMTSRPIAGTRPRGRDAAEDTALEAELLADPKERAEHLMLVDLSRNDVGRVAEPGSVTVTESFIVERYSHVMHIVSNVTGRLRPECDALEAFWAGFPHGTVTGAPKVRAMEIIAELEAERRGVYAGGVGYIGAGGGLDTCIALRTGVIANGTLHVRAGAGVVFDSNPAAEDAECKAKATALFRAAADAYRFV